MTGAVWQRAIWILVAMLVMAVACTGSAGGVTSGSSTATGGTSPVPGRSQRLVVFAASSLLDPFRVLGMQFQEAHPGVTVDFNFAGSAQLVTQLQQGASADVVAFADLVHMKKVQDAGLVQGEPVIFAKNRLTIVVPKRNPAGVQGLADLARPGVKLVIAHQNVPVGTYARTVLQRASQRPEYGPDFASRVLANVVSEEVNVKQVLAKVALGEADAGIVYVTDVQAAGSAVDPVPIPEELNVVACYPIAVIAGARDSALARQFVELVRSDAGRVVLERSGFQAVPSGQAAEGCS